MAALFLCTSDPVLKAEPLGSRLRRVEQLLPLIPVIEPDRCFEQFPFQLYDFPACECQRDVPFIRRHIFRSHSDRLSPLPDPFDLPGRLFLCKPPGFPNEADGFLMLGRIRLRAAQHQERDRFLRHRTLKLFCIFPCHSLFPPAHLGVFRLITTMPQRTGT